MATNQNPETTEADARDARIAELEQALEEARNGSPAVDEKVVKLKHANGTVVHVGESQVDGLKAAGFTK